MSRLVHGKFQINDTLD
uniref:Uncharacterized protein n=1 Tax=Rhizophora mucronata TaxID=61149 RepID=A0A2P2PD45_RHIMU